MATELTVRFRFEDTLRPGGVDAILEELEYSADSFSYFCSDIELVARMTGEKRRKARYPKNSLSF